MTAEATNGLAETAVLKDEVKRAVDAVLEQRDRG